MNTDSRRSVVFNLRAGLMAAHLALACACWLWAYASHRYDGLNIGGEEGDPTFWDTMVGVGCAATLLLWGITFVVSLGTGLARRFPARYEGVAWILAAVVSAPLYSIALALFLNRNVHVAY